jgi:division protein CdvB (Snf7/Vps24/ESCRT-III family)
MLAKGVVRLRGTVARLAANKANLLALSNEMTQMLAMQRAAGSIQASTQLMATMNGLIKVPQLHANMKDMAREMARAGFIQEAMGDAMDIALDSESVEEEATEAVDQVLMEITGETMAQLAAVPSGRVGPEKAAVAAAAEDGGDDELMERLAGLKAAA